MNFEEYPFRLSNGEYDYELISDFIHRTNEVQRSIYIVDILNRYVVCSVSWLKTLSLDELRWLFYSKAPEY